MSYTVDDTNLPADSVESLDEYQFVCRYTIPADAVGTIALQVGGATADLAGNTVTEVTEYIAPFVVVDEPVEEPSEPPIAVDPIEVTLVEIGSEYTFTLEGETYPGYNPSPKLQRILDTHPSTQLPHFAEAVRMIEVVDWVYRKIWVVYPNNIDKRITTRTTVKGQFGLTKKIEDTLFGMYFDFLEGDPNSKYWFYVECFRLLYSTRKSCNSSTQKTSIMNLEFISKNPSKRDISSVKPTQTTKPKGR